MVPRIIVEADGPRGQVLVALSERVVPENLSDVHDAMQLLERLKWAVADAESIASPAASAQRGERSVAASGVVG
jgi:hypothetical protein